MKKITLFVWAAIIALISFFLFFSVFKAETVLSKVKTKPVQADELPLNEKYSNKNFMGRSFKDIPASEFNNTRISNSCFYQKPPKIDADIFPDGMTGVEFEQCNLDNVKIATGNTVKSTGWNKSTNKRIKTKTVEGKDEDWIVDTNNVYIKKLSDYTEEQISE